MIFTSLAALSLGAAPVQGQNPVPSKPVADEAMMATAGAPASPGPFKPSWKPKPKPLPEAGEAKPAARPAATL